MNELLNQQPKGIIFSNRATPIPPEHRPIWRLCLISLILWKVSRSNKASIKKIQALSNVMLSEKKRKHIEEKLKNQNSKAILDIRYDPSVDRAIQIGLSENVFAFDERKNVQLSPKGIKLAKAIESNEELFEQEKAFLLNFSKNDVAEKIINQLITED